MSMMPHTRSESRAMAAGIADHVGSIEEIMGLFETAHKKAA
jgi:hypothetical protein